MQPTLQNAIKRVNDYYGGILDRRTGRTYFPLGVDESGGIHVFSAELDKCDCWDCLVALDRVLRTISKPVPNSRIPT